MNNKSTTVDKDKELKIELDLSKFKGKVFKSIKEFSEYYKDKLYSK